MKNRLDFLYKKLEVESSNHPNFVDARIVEFLKKGNKIEAIKIYRDLTNAGLAEAKNAAEDIEARLGL